MREKGKQVPRDQVPEARVEHGSVTFGQLRKVWNECNAQSLELGYSGPQGFDSCNSAYAVYLRGSDIIFASGTGMPGSYMAKDTDVIIKLKGLIPLVYSKFPIYRKRLWKQKAKRERYWKQRAACVFKTRAGIAELMKRTDLDDKEVMIAYKLGASGLGDHGLFPVPCVSQQAFVSIGKYEADTDTYTKSETLMVYEPAVVSLHGGS